MDSHNNSDRHSNRQSNRSADKYLIAEQPGMTVLLTGLVIAFFIGYTAKSLLSPTRVAAQIEKAASHIHKDIRVTFSSAQVSLSDGILPRFSVIISDVQMSSTQACWLAPLLEVNELRLPVSIWGVLTGGGPIKKIEADDVKLTLRGDMKECERTRKEEKKEITPPTPAVSLSPSEQSDKYQNAVSELSIRSFKIISAQYPQYPTELMDFAVKVKSFEPKVIEVHAKTHLVKDEQVGDYLSHANLFLEYKESPEPTVQSHFFGNWREGRYSTIANYLIRDHHLTVETDLKHIPLSQVLQLLQKYNLVSKDLQGKQVWISTKARLDGDINKIREAPVTVRDFAVEGDLGEMYAEQVFFTSLDPLRYKPIGIEIKKLRVEKLLAFLNRPQNNHVLGDLGSFSGRAEIISENNIRLSGEHTGLQFVFSNKGQREVQLIDKMNGNIVLDGPYWNFQIDHVEPHDGNLVGSIHMKADRDFQEVAIKAQIDEMSFAPVVQKLMTNGGDIGLVKMNADAKLAKGHLSFLKGALDIEDMTVEGLDFGKTHSSFDFAQGEILMNSKVDSLEILQTSPGGQILSQILEPTFWSDGKVALQDINTQFRWSEPHILSWKNFQGKMGKDRKLTADGAWDDKGLLKGSVLVRDGKASKKWLLEGNREMPVFKPESLPNRRMRK